MALPAHLGDWINLLVRWTHLIAGIAWIGSSFYFIWLDSHLTAPDAPRPDVEGELWMVHSGGFYQVEKRLVGPGRMPRTLHWFKWEALLTWLTGFILLVVVYYLTGGVYLLQPDHSPITIAQGALLAAALLVVAWLVYDGLYRSALGRTWAATAVACALLGGAIVLVCRLYSGRAAYIHIGAMLGTLMVANVWMRILPAQRQMIAATARGEQPDFSLGRQAKRRSVHNSYLTFPVLFIMLSNHFPETYAHTRNWLVLILLIVTGALARHAMIGKSARARWSAVPAAAVVVVLFVMTRPAGAAASASASAGGAPVPFAQARAIIQRRCQHCHSRWPADDVFTTAPNGVTFDTPEEIVARAARIKQRAVIEQTMPLGNKTGITPEERATLGRWIDQGAQLR